MTSSRFALFPLALMCGVATLLGCGEAADPPSNTTRRSTEPPREVARLLTVKPFNGCKNLEEYVVDGMVQQMRVQINLRIKQGFGVLPGMGAEGSAPNLGSPAPTSDSAGARSGSTASAPSAYTKTNTQVEGVDEADFVKNDGQRIFVLSGQRLHAVESWPPQALGQRKGMLDIEGHPREMFLDESRNRVVVISEIAEPSSGGGGEPAPALGVAADVAICAPGPYGCGGYRVTHVKLTVVDVSDVTKPVEQESYFLPGRYVNARRVGAAVRLVMADQFQYPEGVRFDPDFSQDPSLYESPERLKAAYEALKPENERLIRARKLEQWLPAGRFMRQGTKVLDLSYRCEDFAYSDAPTRMGLVTVATLNLDNPVDRPSRVSIVAEAGEVFASQQSLYLAHRHWWWWPEPGQMDWTYVHKFDISQPDRALYRASGGFEGHIVDQFSMDEHDGHFRVASTIQRRVPDPQNPTNEWGMVQLTNRVSVLGEKDGSFSLLGESEELAKGERITSARFRGNLGYVVTFREVDPLFVFDLSNPAAPKAVGELRVPGFSTYIHPMDEAHLLTIGVYVPEPDASGAISTQRHLQLAIFDVSDPRNPRQAHLTLIGTANAQSEALTEHKAFNYFPERKLLAIPFSDWVRGSRSYWETFISELRVFHVDLKTGVSPRGALSMTDVYTTAGRTEWGWSYSPWVRRSVMAADPQGNDFVYAISDAGIRVANATRLASPLATAMFPVAANTTTVAP
jgi:uncharacterized secreted protein with C-terminal beta-propeller domain